MFFKFLCHDLRHGLLDDKAKPAITFIVFFLLSSYYYLTLRIYEIQAPQYFESPVTTGDYFLALIGGIGKFTFTQGENMYFTMPVLWIAFSLWLQFVTLYYPFQDLHGFGKHLMIVSGSRENWWFSKCIWTAVTVITHLLIILLACTLSGLCFGAELSMDANF